MRTVFMGSAALGCPALDRLLRDDAVDLAAVVCQPDRPSGRRLRPAPCPTKTAAEAAGVPVLTPEQVNAPDSVASLRAFRPELIVVVAYGQMLGKEILELPPRGCINVHASLLPLYRGAAPIQWAIANGEARTGVTTLYMNARMDAGDLIDQTAVPIGPDDTADTLHDTLAAAGADLLMRTLAALRTGAVRATPQDESRATYAPKLRKSDGRIDWCLAADAIRNRVRAFQPWPGSWCRREGGGVLKLLDARAEARDGETGRVLEVRGEGPLVAAGAGSVRLCRVQPPGKRPMSGAAYARGHTVRVGERLS
ncbi:MAG: methionyl-tRNA formyltransferase [Lentisphaerae bacterium]|nr:methionyl-tRNA formyltransferase [Lentisphaerota bacterium]